MGYIICLVISHACIKWSLCSSSLYLRICLTIIQTLVNTITIVIANASEYVTRFEYSLNIRILSSTTKFRKYFTYPFWQPKKCWRTLRKMQLYKCLCNKRIIVIEIARCQSRERFDIQSKNVSVSRVTNQNIFMHAVCLICKFETQ